MDSAIRQERRLADLMRNFKPVVETYIQQEGPESDPEISPRSDKYFLSRVRLDGGDVDVSAFGDSEEPERISWKTNLLKKSTRKEERFTAKGFTEPLFPDLGHFDRSNYSFEFVKWESQGDVRCGAVDVRPLDGAKNRGFLGRIWVEDHDFNIVRFTGAYTSKALANRAFHFDSWRLNTLGIMWMPAYIYTQESKSDDPTVRDVWFKAQTRIWGYDLQQAGDHKEYAKRLTDTPEWVDPKRNEVSQNLSPANTVGGTTYSPEDNIVERLQLAGLMAPDGEVDQILEQVATNLLITNDLDISGVRCRVLLTTPLESFVMGRTIVLSRGLLDVLPDEASLAAVVAHELAHIVLHHATGEAALTGHARRFSDLEIFSHLNFHFTEKQEAEADQKGLELLMKSPYKDQVGNAAFFLDALKRRAQQLPNLVRSRFSNDFASSHLLGMQVSGNLKERGEDGLNHLSALPLGSRITVDPWSDRITMLKAKPVRLETSAEKRPFEVSPFFPYLKRLDSSQKTQAQR